MAPIVASPPQPVAKGLPPKPSFVTASLQDPYQSSPLRKIAFYFGLALIFTRLSVLPELLAYLFGTGFYILYLIAPPAIGGAVLTGGLKRTFRHRAAYYWIGFFAWMAVSTIFSSWQGGSFARTKDYGLFNLMILVIAGGLATNWREVRLLLYTVAASGVMNLTIARLFMNTEDGRIHLWENGTISNSNDLASQLLLVLPFLVWVTMDSKRSIFTRIPIFGAIGYGVWVIFGTASRGAAGGVVAAFLYLLWRASMRQRLIAIFAGVLLAVIIGAALPAATANRLGTLFGDKDEEAQESATARGHLFRQSIIYTIEHPIVGVGPDQFANYQSQDHEFKHPAWHVTHCAWTQVSSECGIPGLIFFVLGLGSAAFTVNRTYRIARERGNTEIANACSCYLLALLGYLVSITFLSNAYGLCCPLMVGLAISMSLAAQQQLSAKSGPTPLLATPVRY